MKKIKTIVFIFLFASLHAQDSLNVSVLFHWSVDTMPSSYYHDNTYNEIWGYAKNGREYAIIGSTMGTHIFDITNPSTAYQAVFIPGRVQGNQIVHRDFHDYQDYLYIVADEGSSSLQIADLRYLPDSAPVVYDSDTLIMRSHNIFIDSANARLYTCGGIVRGSGNQFSVISLQNPTAPYLLQNCYIDIPWWINTIGYVHDTYVKNNIAFLNAETRGFFIVDFSDLNNVQIIGSYTNYVQQGYNHSGWLHESDTIYAFADETHGTDIKVVNVADYQNIELIDTIGSNVDPNSIVHNLIFRGDFLFVSHYFDGLYIFNMENPDNIFISGYYDTSTRPHQNGKYEGAWGVYPLLPSGRVLVSDMQTGLWVFDVSNAVTSITQQAVSKELIVFPNPASNFIHVSNPEIKNQPYTLTDIRGKKIKSGIFANGYNVIDVSGIPSGVYFLKTSNQSGVHFIKKIIISK